MWEKKPCENELDTLKVSAKNIHEWESFNGDLCTNT
jgi:hypothetical protein